MKRKTIMTKLLLLLGGLFMATAIFAQQRMLTGTVMDATNGDPLPGATVLIKRTTSGTATDINGVFELNVKSGDILTISFVGYETVEQVITDQIELDIQLNPSSLNVDEVVVIGYGTVKKTDATGSMVAVGSKDFNKGAITSVQDLFVGKSAGVVVTTAGGAPGSGATIRIRGGSSLKASNDPLLIIDGIPIDNKNVDGSANFLAFVNPNDIETITILKDASATAIYGSRASNGVVIITTKKGKAGSPMRITYDGNVSVANAIEFLDVYSGDEVRKIAYDHLDLFGADSYTRLGSENTNWQKELFRTAISHNHNLTLTGAYKTLPYRASMGLTDQEGIMKNTGLQRVTGSVNLEPVLLDNTLKVSINAKGMFTKNNFGEVGALGSAINMDPTQPVKDGNQNSDGYFQWYNYGASLGTANPVEQLLAADNKSEVKRLVGNIQFNYKVPVISGLQANLNLATDYTKSDGNNNRPKTSPSTLTGTYWGKLNDYNDMKKNNLLDFYLNYGKDLSRINSNVDITAGYSWQHFEGEKGHFTRGYYDEGHSYQLPDSIPYIPTENQLISFFGRLNYTLADKYLVTATIREDGSSRFSEDNRWGIFPSAAFAWKINKEAFLVNAQALSELKLRLSWGITGQQDISDSDFPYQALYQLSTTGNYYMIDGEYIPTLRPETYDPDIKWEETTTQNIGLDFGFFNNRVSGSIDVYNRVTEDLINEVTIATMSNFSNKLITNIGTLENQGVELSLNLIPLSKKDMSLNLGFNISYNENKITKLLLTDDPDYEGILYGDAFTGQKQVSRVGYPSYSFLMNKQVYDANGNPVEGLYVDLSGEGGTVNGDNSDKYVYKNPAPDYLVGFSAQFNYKKFDISASARGSIGNYVYNQLAAAASYDQMYQLDYWHNQPKYLDNTQFVKRQFTSDYFVENGSYLKLDNISTGYLFDNLPGKATARISFTVQNVFTLTKYSGIDPEVPYKDGVPGVDNNFYPRARTYMVGLSLSY